MIDIYKSAFSEAISSGQWDDVTYYMYIILIMLVALCAAIIENHRNKDGNIAKDARNWLFLPFVSLVFILGLRGKNVGIDTIIYRTSFEFALDDRTFEYSTTEPGYQFMLKVLRYILPNTECFIVLIAVLTLYLIFRTIWNCRNEIDVFAAMFFYVGMYYFQSMNLMRIYLAASILLYNFHYVLNKKYLHYVCIVLLTSLLHFSSLVMLVVVGVLVLYQKSKMIAVLLIITAMCIVIPLSAIYENYIMIARYADYAEGNEASRQVGIMLFFDYFPCFLLIFYAIKKRIHGQWVDLLVVFSLVAFLMRFISYYISIAGRLSIHFMALYLLIVPHFMRYLKINRQRVYPISMVFLILFLLVQIHFYFIAYLAADGIMPYNFIWDE